METLGFEISKRLDKWWYLDNIKTKYFYYQQGKKIMLSPNGIELSFNKWDVKTITLNKAIEFIILNLKLDYDF